MNTTLDFQAQTNEIVLDEQFLRNLVDTEVVLVGGGEFVLVGS
jgi:hypothetical protein